jgi:hypothetical protein
VFATDSTTQKIMVTFDFDRLFDESTMYMITPTEAGVNFNDLTGLVDVNLTIVSSSTTDITFDATLDYGTALNPILFMGATSSDFACFNNTTSTSVAVTAVENFDGNYTLTFAAQTSGDLLTFSVDKDGFDGELSISAV